MNRKNQKAISWVAESALLLALLVVVQLLTFAVPKSVPLIGQLFTGSLVNLVLIVGVGSVGFSGTAVAAVASPLFAYAFGQMPFPQMILIVALGNLVIVAVLGAFFRRSDSGKAPSPAWNAAGVIVGAAAKTAFLWIATVWLMIPVFFGRNSAVASKLALMFSWPQAVTAVIGGALALLILPTIRAYRSRRV